MNNYMPTNWTACMKQINSWETYNLPKLNQKESENLNRQITPSETEEVVIIIKDSQQTKALDRMASWGNFTKYSAKNYHLFSNYFITIQEEGRLPNAFYKASIILIPKPNKDTTKKENYSPIFLVNIHTEISNKMLAN